jgi:hypothetical protein
LCYVSRSLYYSLLPTVGINLEALVPTGLRFCNVTPAVSLAFRLGTLFQVCLACSIRLVPSRQMDDNYIPGISQQCSKVYAAWYWWIIRQCDALRCRRRPPFLVGPTNYHSQTPKWRGDATHDSTPGFPTYLARYLSATNHWETDFQQSAWPCIQTYQPRHTHILASTCLGGLRTLPPSGRRKIKRLSRTSSSWSPTRYAPIASATSVRPLHTIVLRHARWFFGT